MFRGTGHDRTKHHGLNVDAKQNNAYKHSHYQRQQKKRKKRRRWEVVYGGSAFLISTSYFIPPYIGTPYNFSLLEAMRTCTLIICTLIICTFDHSWRG
jgi:hypothetical protein